jgi:hypothetical protein
MVESKEYAEDASKAATYVSRVVGLFGGGVAATIGVPLKSPAMLAKSAHHIARDLNVGRQVAESSAATHLNRQPSCLVANKAADFRPSNANPISYPSMQTHVHFNVSNGISRLDV